jgi:diguanylate cyclase (GGDEF)-like protein
MADDTVRRGMKPAHLSSGAWDAEGRHLGGTLPPPGLRSGLRKETATAAAEPAAACNGRAPARWDSCRPAGPGKATRPVAPQRERPDAASMGLPRSRPWLQPLANLRRMLDLASSKRFRAAARRPLRTAARRSMGIVVLAAIGNCIWLLPGDLSHVLGILGPNVAAAGFASVVFLILRGSRPVRVEILVVIVLIAVDAATAITGKVDLELERVAAGYQLLLPSIVAIMIPWNTRIHLSWLAVHVAIVGLASIAVAPGAEIPGGARALIGSLVVAGALSICGHLAGLHARVDDFEKLQEMRSINRRARRTDADLRRVNEVLEKVARTDRLTGLGNRLALHEQLRSVRSRIGRYDERYPLLLLDLDHFKGVNDALGHFVGDEVLIRVASQLAQTTRDSDTAFRFGGEEFIVLLPLPSHDELRTLADRLRMAIERLGIAHPANPPYDVITVSVGATAIDRARLGEADETWLHDADVALYEAKALGRNRTVVARSRPGAPVVARLASRTKRGRPVRSAAGTHP